MYCSELIHALKEGNPCVIPTDTVYGIVALARNKDSVEKVYELRKRTPTKPCIVLISDIAQLQEFTIPIENYKDILNEYWLGPVSIIIPCINEAFQYLHRGTHTIAFRLPNNTALRELLRVTGPLIAPSANHEGLPPARTVEEAKHYFGTNVPCYVDGGTKDGPPSTIISLKDNGEVIKIR